MEKIIASVPHNRILFLGDVEDDIRMISRLFPQEKIITVTGNNDFLPEPQYEKIFREDNLSLLVCHGHKYNVKKTVRPLFSAIRTGNLQNMIKTGFCCSTRALSVTGGNMPFSGSTATELITVYMMMHKAKKISAEKQIF